MRLMKKFGGMGTICLLFSLVFTLSKKPRPLKKKKKDSEQKSSLNQGYEVEIKEFWESIYLNKEAIQIMLYQ